MNENLKMLTLSELFYEVSYTVPIYQRNYAWEELEIEQLLEDIDSLTDDGDYFLGNLIVNQKANHVYEVIDGQQRLTTVYLLLRYLNRHTFSEEALSFEAREKSNETLARVSSGENRFTEKSQSQEILAGYKVIENYFKKNGAVEEGFKEKFVEKLSKIKLIRIQVPKDIDLNHYFEIMNTRGEQLELHEIAKAKLLGKLDSSQDKKCAALIWEACSNMNSYVQMNFDATIRQAIFNKDWKGLSEKISDFSTLRQKLDLQNETDNRQTLKAILQTKKLDRGNREKAEEDENERFESIISFPSFLLQVNAALKAIKGEDDSRLDDKNLLDNLNENWTDAKSAEEFIFTLLKCRVLFDKYILKREYAKDYKEEGKWSLQRLKKSESSSGPTFLGTFEEEKNKIIRTLQSALRITYTSPKTMHWISAVLSSLLKDDKADVLSILESYAKKKVRDSNYKDKKGFGFERIVFNYLDYLLYKKGYRYGDKEMIPALDSNWQFQFRSSIEHFYPQHPAENEEWNDKDLNSFGNLALITVSGNSKFSNTLPGGKAETYPSIIEQSLKLKIMAKRMKEEDKWMEDLAREHEKEMFKLLDEGCK